MMDLFLTCNNFYEKKDIEMEFAVMCSSTHKVFTHTLQELNICTGFVSLQTSKGTQILAMFVEALPE
jgi:hypothetical protein